jgi:putative nucleotidyltransferase with HDIG domain
VSSKSDLNLEQATALSLDRVGSTSGASSNSTRSGISQQLWTALYVLGLSVAAVTVSLFSFSSSSITPSLPTVALLIVVAVLAERSSVTLAPSIEVSVAYFPTLFAAVVFGGFWAGVVGAAGLSLHFGRPYLRWISWVATRAIVATTAGEVAHYFQQSDSHSLASLTYRAIIAVVIYAFLDTTIAAATLKVRKTSGVAELMRMSILIDATSILLCSPFIAVIAYAYYEAPRWTLLLFVAPAFAAERVFLLYREQRETAANLSEAVAKLERVNLSFATALVTALDARDHYTAGHSAAVAVYARDIAKELELSEDQRKRAHLCGLLHDIGKIGVPTGVLEKEGPLAPKERNAIESHAEVGASIIGRIEGYEEIATVVRHHHERYEGGGYPDRIGGDAIPLMARIAAVADAYSAMTSERPYRIALSGQEARERLEQEAGKQFDPQVVGAFVAVLERAGEAYASGTHSDFESELAELTALEPEPSLAVST